MDLTLNQQERGLIARMGETLGQRSQTGALDAAHWAALHAGGLLADLAGPAGLLAASLAVSEAARLGSLTPLGVHALVLPLFQLDAGEDRLAAIADLDDPGAGLARYGAEAGLLIRYEGAAARLYPVDPKAARRPPSQYVYPLAIPAAPAGPAIGEAPAEAVLARHRLAVAAEAVGAMDSALAALRHYLTHRKQFGRPLGALQAIQHRLAELAIDLEMARWTARQAAWDETAASAAIAAAYAARRARRFAFEVHQLSGARGYTLALGLSFDTLRLQALSVEAGGAKAHEADGFALVWGEVPSPTGR
jgi:hypothetical protein